MLKERLMHSIMTAIWAIKLAFLVTGLVVVNSGWFYVSSMLTLLRISLAAACITEAILSVGLIWKQINQLDVAAKVDKKD